MLRFVSLAALGAALAASVPWLGPLYLILAGAAALTFIAVDLMIKRVSRPELVSAAAIVITLGILAFGVAWNGGPTSPALPWLVLPLGTAAARFRPQVVGAALALTLAVIAAVTLGIHPAATLHNPVPVFATVGLAISLVAIVWAIQAAELQHRERAVIDPLTSLFNRTSLPGRFAELALQARLSGRPVCLLACDLDRFKEINDTYGHDRGDAVLQDVAAELRNQLRSFELVYRLGGEEFLVVLPGVGLRRGSEVAERLRAAIEARQPGGIAVTISIGAAAASGERVAFEPLFKAADNALYDAKRAGGNAVVAAGPLHAPAAG